MYILQSTLIRFVTDQETPCIEPFARITMRGDEKVQNMFWLFPIIFMLHEMEEIIGLRIWLDKNRDIVRKYNKVSMLYQNFSNEGFSIAVLEEYLLCIIITGVSIFFKIYIVWIGAFIAFSLHLLVHIIQCIIIKRYIPALASSIILLPISIFIINKAIYTFKYTFFSIVISSILCIITMLFNLIFVHKIMKTVCRHFSKYPKPCRPPLFSYFRPL